MSAFRSSRSERRLRQKYSVASSPPNVHSQESSQDASSRSQSPSNRFVIPGRTRYPSTQSPDSPQPLDFRVARALLDRQRDDTEASTGSHNQNQRPIERPDESRTRATAVVAPVRELNSTQSGEIKVSLEPRIGFFDGPFDPKSTIRNTSGQSASGLSSLSFALSRSDSLVSSGYDYATIYNRLAARHSLRHLRATSASGISKPTEKTKGSTNAKPIKAGSKNWFLAKLTRNASSKDLRNSNARLNRKNSLGSLLGHRPKVSLKSQSLDDICRLGGIGVLELPPKYKAIRLELPTCLAATANYLALHCRDTPGIFRIPGQTSVTNALYDHYVFRISDAENCGHIEATVGSLNLPPGLSPSVHDVASTFKKFLWDLPGGILGSMALFETLKEICDLPTSENLLSPDVGSEHADLVKLIALAIVSLGGSGRRIALICSVLGLLAFLKRDKELVLNVSPSRHIGPESMSSKALGVVFAPILLGNLTEDLEVDVAPRDTINQNQLVTPRQRLMGHRKMPKQSPSARQSFEMAAGFERAKICGAVIEKLLRSWEDISAQILSLRATADCDIRANFAQTNVRLGMYTTETEASGGTTSFPSHTIQLPTDESIWEARGLRSLPYPPTPSLHFDAAIHRSASVCVMSNSHRDGDGQVQFQTPNNLKKLARSNTTLHLSDPVGWSPIKQPLERSAKMVQDIGSHAWWERKTPGDATFANNARLSSGSAGLDTVPRSSQTSQGIFHSPDAIKFDSRLSDSNSITVCFPTLPLQTSEKFDIEQPPMPGKYNCNNSSDDGQDKLPVNSSSLRSLTSPSCHSISAEDTSTAFERCSVRTTASGETALPVKGSIVPARNLHYSPSMIPRPVNDARRNRNLPLLTTITSQSQRESFPPFGTPPIASASASKNTQSLPRRHFSNVAPTKADQTTLSHLPTRASHSADRPYPKSHSQVSELLRIPGPQANEPPVARRINFRPSPKENVRRTPSSSTMSQHESGRNLKNKPNVGTLYAEIRRLHHQLSARQEEIGKLKHHIDALKRFRDSGTLSEKLREAERDTRMWRYRAQWAEMELFGRTLEREVPGTARRVFTQVVDGGNNGHEKKSAE